jgi:hypothetical protein
MKIVLKVSKIAIISGKQVPDCPLLLSMASFKNVIIADESKGRDYIVAPKEQTMNL